MQNQTSNGTFGSLDHDTPNVPLHWTYTVAKILMKYVLPVIIITGLPGNVVSILVFLTRDLRRLSSSVYVLAVLMSDIGFLINLFFLWLEVRLVGFSWTRYTLSAAMLLQETDFYSLRDSKCFIVQIVAKLCFKNILIAG